MEIIISSTTTTDPIVLNHDSDNFKVSVFGVVSGDFSGDWTVEYSPNGEDWFPHEDLTAVTAYKNGNLYFQVPYIRVVTNITAGTLKFYVYGSEA